MAIETHVYRGTPFTITTTLTEQGWTARARIDDTELETPQTYPTEKEARKAALQVAGEQILRSRMHQGKP